MFRYGAAEKLFILGYTVYDVKEAGDWASIKMPVEYAKKKGLSVAQKKYAEDLRII